MNAVVEALGAVPWLEVVDWAGAALLAVGVFFCLVAAIGLLRLPDTFSRMHAASKPQLVGLVFVCTGIVLDTLQWRWVVLGIVVVSLQILTAPVGSHLLGRGRVTDGVRRPGRPRDRRACRGHRLLLAPRRVLTVPTPRGRIPAGTPDTSRA